jgi:hypothetical protein
MNTCPYCGSKKNRVESGRNRNGTFERSDEVLQDLLDDTQPTHWYYSNAALVYEGLLYPRIHFMMPDKSPTYSSLPR